jgi:T4-like virus tail tube protein gp19
MAFDPKRTATASRFVMELDGKHAAYLKKYEGLNYEADIAAIDHGMENFQTKHMANYKYTPGKISMGLAMGKVLNDWIAASFNKQYMTKSGAFVAADFNYKATHRVDFINALITEVTVPALKGDAKDPGFLDVSFDAEDVKHSKANGEDIRGDYGVKNKAWIPANFSFSLTGLEDACKRVASIDSFTWKQAVVSDQIGSQRIHTKHPANVKVPDLKIQLSAADKDPWQAWADSWFRMGKSLASDHRDGVITFLGPDMQQVLGTIELKGVGLKSFGDQPHEANAEKIKRIDVGLYVEHMTFNMNFTDM